MRAASSAGAVVCFAACAAILSGFAVIPSPGAPTAAAPASAAAPAPTISLTVRVLARGSEAPVTAATVFRDRIAVSQTDADGIAHAEVPVGVEFSIDVTAPGFLGSGASATVSGQERWTFYLERSSD
jgi:hypothetical protein